MRHEKRLRGLFENADGHAPLENAAEKIEIDATIVKLSIFFILVIKFNLHFRL